MGAGSAIFFPLTAVQSVPFLIYAVCLALRGLIIAPEKKSKFTGLLIFYGIYILVFLFPIVNYTWMDAITDYDLLYHSIGFILSIAIALVALSVSTNTGTAWRGLFWKVYLLCWAYQLLMIFVPNGGSSGFFTTSLSAASRIFQGLYALAQIMVPLIATQSLLRDKNRLIAERHAQMTASTPAPAPSPYYTDETGAVGSGSSSPYYTDKTT